LLIDAIDCPAMVKNSTEYIVHQNECPITQKNILLMLSNSQHAQMKTAPRNPNAARRQ